MTTSTIVILWFLSGLFVIWLTSVLEKEFFRSLSSTVIFIGVFLAPLCLPFILWDFIKFINNKIRGN